MIIFDMDYLKNLFDNGDIFALNYLQEKIKDREMIDKLNKVINYNLTIGFGFVDLDALEIIKREYNETEFNYEKLNDKYIEIKNIFLNEVENYLKEILENK